MSKINLNPALSSNLSVQAFMISVQFVNKVLFSFFCVGLIVVFTLFYYGHCEVGHTMSRWGEVGPRSLVNVAIDTLALVFGLVVPEGSFAFPYVLLFWLLCLLDSIKYITL